MKKEIEAYNQTVEETAVCNRLATLIDENLVDSDNKIWHSHPVWFIAGNPIVGYSKQKKGIRLMFWSGADFEESNLEIRGGKFKDASIFYNFVEEIDEIEIRRWLDKSAKIQWDYKNVVKRKGKLELLKL
jgi:ribosomal protein S18